MDRKTTPLSLLSPRPGITGKGFLAAQRSASCLFFLHLWFGGWLADAMLNMAFDSARADAMLENTMADPTSALLSEDPHSDSTVVRSPPSAQLSTQFSSQLSPGPIEGLYIETWNRLPSPVQIALTPRPKLVVTTDQPEEWGLFAMQKGAYDPEKNVLKVHWTNRLTADELQRTFLHEWGHALALRTLSAQTVCRFATELGPWSTLSKPCDQVAAHLDATLFQPHPMRDAPRSILERKGRIPSRYALANAHEYLAEMFAEWLTGGPASDPLLERAWTNLVETAARHAEQLKARSKVRSLPPSLAPSLTRSQGTEHVQATPKTW